MSAPLAGRTIVVTRPREQAAALAAAIRARGGAAILFPTLEIFDPTDAAALDAVIDRLDRFDLAIFVSPIAVGRALRAVSARRELPPKLKIAAVGSGSVRALAQHGFTAVIAPAKQADSESLLAEPELADVAGKHIVIFRGEGGRELLKETLVARGAIVEYVQCYRRARPAADAAPLLDAWTRNALDAFVVTSVEGLDNLWQMLPPEAQARLRETPVFVPHSRIAAAAATLGLNAVIDTAPGDEGLVDSLAAYFASRARR